MARQQNIAALGIPPATAQAIVGRVADDLTATGSTQGTALPLPADINRVTTAAASTGVILPPLATGGTLGIRPGDEIIVINSGANAVLVYPPVGGTVNALSANAGFSVAAGGRAQFTTTNGLAYFAILSA